MYPDSSLFDAASVLIRNKIHRWIKKYFINGSFAVFSSDTVFEELHSHCYSLKPHDE